MTQHFSDAPARDGDIHFVGSVANETWSALSFTVIKDNIGFDKIVFRRSLYYVMKFFREYFIGEYLRSEQAVIKQANIRLVFNVMLASVCLLTIVSFVYALRGFHHHLLKSLIVMTLFVGTMFYLRLRKSIDVIAHVLIVISLINILVNVFVLFQDFNAFGAIITVLDILFAFHILGSRWGIFYAVCHFVPLLMFECLRYADVRLVATAPQQLAFNEVFVSLMLLFMIVLYLIYFYHQAFDRATESLYKNLEELRQAKETAEEMARLKTNLLSNMSHEIRTPINGILGISQVIETETSDPNIREYVHLQQQSGRRLLETMSSILNLSRIEASTTNLNLSIVDINDLMNQSALPLKESAIRKQLSFSLELSNTKFQCLSDADMLRQVVTNIIGNAIKFTNKGYVAIRIAADEAIANTCCITVADTGVGISEEFMPKIFNPFEQESSGRARQYEGSGLGLSIAKRYIELMGGDIRVHSIKGKGTSFQVVLPIYRSY